METNNWVESSIRDMAKKAIKEHKAFEYMIFWMKEPIGWQNKAKKYLREAIKNYVILEDYKS